MARGPVFQSRRMCRRSVMGDPQASASPDTNAAAHEMQFYSHMQMAARAATLQRHASCRFAGKRQRWGGGKEAAGAGRQPRGGAL